MGKKKNKNKKRNPKRYFQPSQPSQSSHSSQRSVSGEPAREQKSATVKGLIEIIETEDGLRYLMGDGSLKSIVVEDENRYVPFKPDLFGIPGGDVLELLKKEDPLLFDDLRKFIYDHLECPDERHYGILAAYVLHTYLVEKSEASPIIRFYGTKGSGKSRGGEVLGRLARRGISTAALTGPGLFRVNQFYDPTFIIDEIQIYGKTGDKDLRDMLNVRYKRGVQIIRINKDKSGPDAVETFKAFGPTVVCGTDELPDTVSSRCITLYMESNEREVERQIDYQRAGDLRNRLMAFRFRHFKTQFDLPERIVRNGRLEEILTPLHQIIKLAKPEFETEFMEFAKNLETERREENFSTYDAEIVRALIDSKEDVVVDRVEVDKVTSRFNKKRPDDEKQNSRRVGAALTRLGLEICRMPGNGRFARRWDEAKIKRLAQRFGVEYYQGCECSECCEGSELCELQEVMENTFKTKGER